MQARACAKERRSRAGTGPVGTLHLTISPRCSAGRWRRRSVIQSLQARCRTGCPRACRLRAQRWPRRGARVGWESAMARCHAARWARVSIRQPAPRAAGHRPASTHRRLRRRSGSAMVRSSTRAISTKNEGHLGEVVVPGNDGHGASRPVCGPTTLTVTSAPSANWPSCSLYREKLIGIECLREAPWQRA